MYDQVMKTITVNYPELDPEAIEFVFPYWEVAPRAS